MGMNLEEEVLSEAKLLEITGWSKKQLGHVRREKGLPSVNITRNCRVYLAVEVLDWLKGIARESVIGAIGFSGTTFGEANPSFKHEIGGKVNEKGTADERREPKKRG